MPSDRDIWASANQMLRQHGENAALEAGMRADAALANGDIDGERTWLRVIKAIAWLSDNRGRDPFKVEH